MKLSDAWLMQSRSDWDAAQRVFCENAPLTYCQSIAKCQQTVEKAVKALVTALGEADIMTLDIGWKHEVEKFVAAFARIPRRDNVERRDIIAGISALFSDDIRSGIRTLDAFVPKRPPPGQLLQRNTEYPFHATDGTFSAPAEADVFSLETTRRCQSVAERVYIGCDKLTRTLRRI